MISTQGTDAYRKVHNNPFYQQKLPAWTPTFRTSLAYPLFGLASVIFFSLAILTFLLSREIVEVKFDYTDCLDAQSNPCRDAFGPCLCKTKYELKTDIKGPVYMYYNIDGMYLNYRSFLSNIKPTQFTGADIPPQSLGQCVPFDKRDGKAVLPCGAYARALFNDTFKMFHPDNKEVTLKKSGIAWDTDVKRKYGIISKEVANKTIKPDSWAKSILERSDKPFKSDESLMVWLRPSVMPNFIKLYAIIELSENVLKRGNYSFEIDYNFPVSIFRGRKSIVLGNAGFIGGRNMVYPITLMIGGIIYAVLSIVMFLINAGRIKRIKRKSDENRQQEMPRLRTRNIEYPKCYANHQELKVHLFTAENSL